MAQIIKTENELEIVTLEDALYLTMKNDVSICYVEISVLWEQQSSVNPNMPLRGLLYFAREYEGWLASRKKRYLSQEVIEKYPPHNLCILQLGKK